MEETDFVIVLTTLGLDADAEAFARTLVEERLAACVNVHHAMDSIYRWKGRIEREQERQIVIKTMVACVPGLAARLRAIHPYEVPEFLVIPVVEGSDAYLKWLRDATAP